MAAPSAAEAVQLFKALIREARKFPNYNVREYVKRRTLEGFRENRSVTDPAVTAVAYAYGQESLVIARRQSVVYGLYAPRAKSVMDLKFTESS